MKNEEHASDDDEDGEKFAKHTHKKHQNLFQANPLHLDYGNEYDDEDEEGSDQDSDDEHQENVFNQQNAFGMQVFAQPATRARVNYGGGLFNNWGAPAAIPAKTAAGST